MTKLIERPNWRYATKRMTGEKGLQAAVLLALSYRNEKTDFLTDTTKARKSK